MKKVKKVKKNILIGALTLGLAVSTVATFVQLNAQPVEAETKTITEFSSEDTTILNKVGFGNFASSVTNINFTSGNGAESVLKANWEAGWKDVSFEFANKLPAASVGSLTIRFYAHLTEGSPACAQWSSLSGVEFKWYEFTVQDQWVDLTIEKEDMIKLANSDGYIDGFIVSINYNQGTPYSDAYIMFDNITYTESRTVTFVHGGGMENETVTLPAGERVGGAQSKKAGYAVEWYTDEGLTNKFDFESVINENITLYGKYEEIVYPRGLAAECTKDDVKLYNQSGLKHNEASGFLPERDFSYVTNLDTDGDGKVDVESAIKVKYTTQWQAYVIRLEKPLKMEKVASVTFRVFFHVDAGVQNPVYTLWGGVKSDYSVPEQSLVARWVAHEQDAWSEVTVSMPDMLAQMTDDNGYFDTFVVSTGFGSAPYEGYMLIDKITYNWNCDVTFDCDTANSGVENVTQTVSNGKKFGTAPDATQKEGYTVEWYTDEARTQKFDLKKDRVEEDMTLYAKYTKDAEPDSTDSTTDSSKPSAEESGVSSEQKKGCGSALGMDSVVATGLLVVAAVICLTAGRKDKKE